VSGWRATLGAVYLGGSRCLFRVWAPRARAVRVRFRSPQLAEAALTPEPRGYHAAVLTGVEPGVLYTYLLDGAERPDPCSRHQPEGVHGPSAVVDPAFHARAAHWRGHSLCRYVIYELHVGTFTPEGTFDAAALQLDRLAALGVTAVELMPVAQFPGGRNWGYDGVFPFAVQNTYGGPHALRRFVDAAHERGLAVVLDVVYNHLGPEGNVLADFGPYFTRDYHTPWGAAINFDGPGSDEVRRLFIENALYWVCEFGVDALRLDAVHAIRDTSPAPFVGELAAAVQREAEQRERRVYVIAESDAGDARLVRSREQHGYGCDAVWNDDFHRALHALVTGERAGYYGDFGRVGQLAKAFTHGFVFTGEYAACRERRHGSRSLDVPAERFVVCAQNHDQIGNRMHGERLAALVSPARLRLALGAVLLAPFIPLLFMGEEYGETAPFQYFVSHGSEALAAAVRAGRKAEFAAHAWQGEPPDPQSIETFRRSQIDPGRAGREPHGALLRFVTRLLSLRRSHPALSLLEKEQLEAAADEPRQVLMVTRRHDRGDVLAYFNFGREHAPVAPLPPGAWLKCLDSADAQWGGPGAVAPDRVAGGAGIVLPAESFAVYTSEQAP
jgi:maltooligosyltrehalose trehalohydrolase